MTFKNLEVYTTCHWVVVEGGASYSFFCDISTILLRWHALFRWSSSSSEIDLNITTYRFSNWRLTCTNCVYSVATGTTTLTSSFQALYIEFHYIRSDPTIVALWAKYWQKSVPFSKKVVLKYRVTHTHWVDYNDFDTVIQSRYKIRRGFFIWIQSEMLFVSKTK